jgi:hypothetical protein
VNPKERAIYMLRTAAMFVDVNHLESRTAIWDDATCDGACLIADCNAAADDLEGAA